MCVYGEDLYATLNCCPASSSGRELELGSPASSRLFALVCLAGRNGSPRITTHGGLCVASFNWGRASRVSDALIGDQAKCHLQGSRDCAHGKRRCLQRSVTYSSIASQLHSVTTDRRALCTRTRVSRIG